MRILAVCSLALIALAACESGPSVNSSGVYQLSSGDAATVQYRMLDSANFMRQAAGVAPLQLNAQLTAAAQSHADDMSRQQRAWPFGSNGSNPYDRVSGTGYSGELVSELYSQSYESELSTLTAWIEDQAWGPAILNSEATEMGVAWHQDASGLIWWVMTLGHAGAMSDIPAF